MLLMSPTQEPTAVSCSHLDLMTVSSVSHAVTMGSPLGGGGHPQVLQQEARGSQAEGAASQKHILLRGTPDSPNSEEC
jgi:hypothetical protein